MKRNQDVGLAVFIGTTKRSDPVMVAWVQCGQELQLLDAVRSIAVRAGEVRVLGTADATEQDVADFRKRNRASCVHGLMFDRTDRVVKDMRAMIGRTRRSLYRSARETVKKGAGRQQLPMAA